MIDKHLKDISVIRKLPFAIRYLTENEDAKNDLYVAIGLNLEKSRLHQTDKHTVGYCYKPVTLELPSHE